MPPEFRQTVPVLRVFDEAKARAFYVDWLGFTVDWEHRFEPGLPLYMQVTRGNLTLHLTEHHGDCCPGATAFVRMAGIRDLHAELLAMPNPNCRPGLEETPWGTHELTIIDPFGNRLRFSEDRPNAHA